MRRFAKLAALASGLLIGSIAQASTLEIYTIRESSPVIGLYDRPEGGYDLILKDFTGNPNENVIETDGRIVEIYGGVRHKSGTDKYQDAWTLDTGADAYRVTFTWYTDPTLNTYVDFELIVDGASQLYAGDGGVEVWDSTGQMVFYLDPTEGGLDEQEDILWILNATPLTAIVAAVPLPAGAALGLTGLLAFAGLKRRKKA